MKMFSKDLQRMMKMYVKMRDNLGCQIPKTCVPFPETVIFYQ